MGHSTQTSLKKVAPFREEEMHVVWYRLCSQSSSFWGVEEFEQPFCTTIRKSIKMEPENGVIKYQWFLSHLNIACSSSSSTEFSLVLTFFRLWPIWFNIWNIKWFHIFHWLKVKLLPKVVVSICLGSLSVSSNSHRLYHLDFKACWDTEL